MMARHFFILLILLLTTTNCGEDVNAPLKPNQGIVEAGNPPKPSKLRSVKGILQKDSGVCTDDQVQAFDLSGTLKAVPVNTDCSFLISLGVNKAWGIDFIMDGQSISMVFMNGPDQQPSPVYYHGETFGDVNLGQVVRAEESLKPQNEPSRFSDRDGDTLNDYLDTDDDNDGILDINETDCNNDGILDDFEPNLSDICL